MTLIYIIIATLAVSLISFAGVLVLFLKPDVLKKLTLVLVALSAGSLIGGAMLHLLPEAVEEVVGMDGDIVNVFLFGLLGFAIFFVLEQFIHWHHHHDADCDKVSPFSYLVLISDGIHNLIDGFIIAASFVISIPIGIASTIAVIFHEVPQEIGDFGVLIHGGMSKIRALALNFISALVAVVGGIAGYLFSDFLGESTVYLLPLAAGSFIYIAASDLIPEIKHKDNIFKALTYFVVFLLGIGLMWLLLIFGE